MISLKTITFISLLSSSAYADYYSAPLSSADWKLDKGYSSCQLSQDIPFYGKADFIHQSGQPLSLSIREDRYKAEIVKASLVVNIPSWSHQSNLAKNYLVTLDHVSKGQNYPSLNVYGSTAESMLDALSNGLSPTFIYARSSINGKLAETSVALSSVNFIEKYQQFVDCRKDFLPAGFKDLLEKSIFFKQDSQQLSKKAAKQLKDTAKFVQQVKNSQVIIASDTAFAGKRDKKWFLKRAHSIKSRLNKLGVAKNKIVIQVGQKTMTNNQNSVRLSLFGPDALDTIYYRKGNTQLTWAEKRRLDVLAHYAETYLPNKKLLIKSHTDSKGSKAKNLIISQKRGDVIKQYLISQGMDENKVSVKAYGESKPVRINRFESGRSQNRRVNIEFIG